MPDTGTVRIREDISLYSNRLTPNGKIKNHAGSRMRKTILDENIFSEEAKPFNIPTAIDIQDTKTTFVKSTESQTSKKPVIEADLSFYKNSKAKTAEGQMIYDFNLANLKEQISKIQGIPVDYVEHYLDMLKMGVVFGSRPCNFSDPENCAGKGMDVKSKTANEGKYLAGFIPVDQSFSKLDSNIEFYNGQSEKFLKLPHASKTILTDENGNEVYGLKKGSEAYKDSNGTKIFLVRKDGKFYSEGTDEVFSQAKMEALTIKPKKIEVLCYKKKNAQGKNINKKIVGDLDPMLYGGNKDILSAMGMNLESVTTSNELKGNLTQFSEIMTSFLSKKTADINLSTHGAESENIDMTEDNFDCYIWIPKDKNFMTNHKFQLIECHSREDLCDTINTAEERGCKLSINPNWGLQRSKKTSKLEINPIVTSMKSISIAIMGAEKNLTEAKKNLTEKKLKTSFFRKMTPASRTEEKKLKSELNILESLRKHVKEYNEACLKPHRPHPQEKIYFSIMNNLNKKLNHGTKLKFNPLDRLVTDLGNERQKAFAKLMEVMRSNIKNPIIVKVLDDFRTNTENNRQPRTPVMPEAQASESASKYSRIYG